MKIQVDEKLRASVDEAVSELSQFLAEKAERDREIDACPDISRKMKAEMEKLQQGFRMTDTESPKKIADLRQMLDMAHRRSVYLQAVNGQMASELRRANQRALAPIGGLAALARDAVIADVASKLRNIFGKDEASRMAEYATPVRVLNELIHCRFDDGNMDSLAPFELAQRMVQFTNAALSEAWDPFKWRRNADLMKFLSDGEVDTDTVEMPDGRIMSGTGHYPLSIDRC